MKTGNQLAQHWKTEICKSFKLLIQWQKSHAELNKKESNRFTTDKYSFFFCWFLHIFPLTGELIWCIAFSILNRIILLLRIFLPSINAPINLGKNTSWFSKMFIELLNIGVSRHYKRLAGWLVGSIKNGFSRIVRSIRATNANDDFSN